MTEPAAVLVVEDESAISQFLCASLSAAGLQPRAAGTLAQARAELARAPCALVVLDLGLPDGDGVDLVRELRGRGQGVPVLVLSARSTEANKIDALDAGADDYLTKPFSAGELLARVRAMLRRAVTPPMAAAVLRVGALEIDCEAQEVRLAGQRVKLSPRELALLSALARKPGKVLTHRQLLAQVWGPEQVDQLHYLRIYMGHLRAKLETDPGQPRYLLTELGIGYRLADE